jgi:hypothetical protein
MKRKSIPQFEFGFSAAAFNLAGEAAEDGDRIAQERAARLREWEIARQRCAEAQPELVGSIWERKTHVA